MWTRRAARRSLDSTEFANIHAAQRVVIARFQTRDPRPTPALFGLNRFQVFAVSGFEETNGDRSS